MTAEDRDAVRTIVKEEIGLAVEAAQAHTDTSIRTLRDEMIEAVRDMQTEMLRGLERFSRGNFSRFHTVETTQADVNTRLGLLEERVLAVELRMPPQPPQH